MCITNLVRSKAGEDSNPPTPVGGSEGVCVGGGG